MQGVFEAALTRAGGSLGSWIVLSAVAEVHGMTQAALASHARLEGATITHHVDGSLFPEDLGKHFTRFFTIEGDTFTLRFTSKSADGGEVTRTLVFRRAR